MRAGSEINFATTMGLLTRCNPLMRLFQGPHQLGGIPFQCFLSVCSTFGAFGHPVSLVLGLRNGPKRGIDLTAVLCPCSNLS